MARRRFISFLKGVVASLTLVTVIIIMNEFMQGTPLLPTLDMTTFGAAVAAGMLIQWLGHRYYLPLISGAGGAPASPAPDAPPAPVAAPGGGVEISGQPASRALDSAPRSMAVGDVNLQPAPTGQADLAGGGDAADDDEGGASTDDD